MLFFNILFHTQYILLMKDDATLFSTQNSPLQFLCPIAAPFNLIDQLIHKRHQQLLQKYPTIHAEVENDRH
jgi:hypothetical protein